jgi:hypothetical protein
MLVANNEPSASIVSKVQVLTLLLTFLALLLPKYTLEQWGYACCKQLTVLEGESPSRIVLKVQDQVHSLYWNKSTNTDSEGAVYSLYWYKSTNTDSEGATGAGLAHWHAEPTSSKNQGRR